MNATLINTAPNQALDHGDRLQAPVTPRRKLQIPTVFASPGGGGISGKISTKEPRTPGKLKIPAAFSDLNSFKSFSLDDSVDCQTLEKSGEKQVEEPLPTDKVESSEEKIETTEQFIPDTVLGSGPESVSPETLPTESKPKRKIRKHRKKQLTSKEQLLAEIAALEKEIRKATLEKTNSKVSQPVTSLPETIDSRPLLPNALEVTRQFILPDEPRRPFQRKDSGAGDSLVVLESESSDNEADDALGRDVVEIAPTNSTDAVIEAKVDTRSIQSPRTKIKNLKKLSSFFRRKKNKKAKSDVSMNVSDCLV